MDQMYWSGVRKCGRTKPALGEVNAPLVDSSRSIRGTTCAHLFRALNHPDLGDIQNSWLTVMAISTMVMTAPYRDTSSSATCHHVCTNRPTI